MKKLLALLLVALSLASSCLAEAATPAMLEQQLRAELDGVLPYNLCIVSASYDVVVTLPADTNIAFFGEYILRIREVCQPLLDSGTIAGYSLSWLSKADSSKSNMIFTPDVGDIGLLIDRRSGESKSTVIGSLDELAALFPQLYTSGRMSDVPKDDLTIYNEVWAALDAKPDTPEKEIYAEICGKYGMTAEELAQFMWDTMDKILSGN